MIGSFYLNRCFRIFSIFIISHAGALDLLGRSANPAFILGNFVERDELKTVTISMPDVRPDQMDTYLCTATRVNATGDNFIVKFMPHASEHNVHHMLLFGCSSPGAEQNVWNCGGMHTTTVISQYSLATPCQGKQTILYAWAMNAPALDLPPDVGFKIGGTSEIDYLVLQVHYMHPLQAPDTSALSVQVTTKLLPKRAGVILMTTGGKISAHTTEKFEVSCSISDNVQLHPFAFRVHTHKLGKVVSGYLIDNRQWHLIGKRNPQEPQVLFDCDHPKRNAVLILKMFYPVANTDLVIRRGNFLAARCTMENYLDTDVRIGPSSNDEMCNYYVMYWVNGDDILNSDWCGTGGPPVYYWAKDSYLARSVIPDIDASTLPQL